MNRGKRDSSAKVLALLREHNEGRTVPEIAKELHMPYSSVCTAVNTLSREVCLANEGPNYYLLDWRTL